MHEHDRSHRVLLVDRDADLAEVVAAVLRDEGYRVSTLANVEHSAIAGAVNRDEPDCILLDAETPSDYGQSWREAAYLAARQRSIPTVMFATQPHDLREARQGESDRARAAQLTAIVAKPFELDELLAAVAGACGTSVPFDRSVAADRKRSQLLAARLREAGATDIRTSDRREWATFRAARDGQIYQIYWWERSGVYVVGHYDERAHLDHVGQFFELESAIAGALTQQSPQRFEAAPAAVRREEPSVGAV